MGYARRAYTAIGEETQHTPKRMAIAGYSNKTNEPALFATVIPDGRMWGMTQLEAGHCATGLVHTGSRCNITPREGLT